MLHPSSTFTDIIKIPKYLYGFQRNEMEIKL